jgi:3-hydroxybutyrate dehydrogenase
MLKGKSAIVTGSSSGIGLDIASAFAAQGVDVLLNGFGDPAQIEETRRGLESRHGVKVCYCAADMSKPGDIRTMAGYARAEFGKVDIIVNNAGIQHVAPVEEFPDEKWDAIQAIHLASVFHLIKAVVPEMKTRRWGRIINVASAHGLTASQFKSAYVSAKHGMIGLARTVALEVAEHGITCNTICPGYVKTPLVDQQIADQAKAHGISPERVVPEVMLVHQAREEFVRGRSWRRSSFSWARTMPHRLPRRR